MKRLQQLIVELVSPYPITPLFWIIPAIRRDKEVEPDTSGHNNTWQFNGMARLAGYLHFGELQIQELKPHCQFKIDTIDD